MNESSVLFCPFCREPFEGLERCPTHDLGLVGFRELSRLRLPRDDEREPWHSLRAGRGFLLAGVLVTLLAFFLPLGRLSGAIEVESSLRELCARAPRLWLVPCAALATLSVMARRRTPAGMRSARLVMGMLALIPSGVVGFTLIGTREAAQLLAANLGGGVQFHVGLGSWLVWAALPLLAWGSLRFGVMPLPRVR